MVVANDLEEFVLRWVCPLNFAEIEEQNRGENIFELQGIPFRWKDCNFCCLLPFLVDALTCLRTRFDLLVIGFL